MHFMQDVIPQREPRTRTAGEVLIELGAHGRIIHGQLLDVSEHGFAIRHDYDGFVPGQEVRVLYDWGNISARLVWVGPREGGMAAGFRTD